jgi:hypothetical protein
MSFLRQRWRCAARCREGPFHPARHRARAFDKFAFDQQIDFAFDYNVHGNAAGITFVEDGLTRRNGEGVRFVMENFDRDQLASPCAGRRVYMKKL